MILTSKFSTPLGEMIAGATDTGLCMLGFTDGERHRRIIDDLTRILKTGIGEGENDHIKNTRTELTEYFEGQRKEFNIPLVMAGSDFQEKVWKALSSVPYGTTRSYSSQAASIGKKEIIRAVARANGMNRICIIIPCHRVIGSDGSLTGYSGGIERKKWLLGHERRNSANLQGELNFNPEKL